MEIIQVMLVGGRQTPNVTGVMRFRPSQVVLIVSKDEREKKNILLDSLRNIESFNPPDEEDIIEVDAYDFQENLAAIRGICGKYHNKKIQFNLTGSTKVMALAAYEIAREEGIASFYVAGNRILWLAGEGHKVVEPINLKIEQYLKIFGRETSHKFKFDNLSFDKQRAIEAARLLAINTPSSTNMLKKIRSNKQIKGSAGLQVPLCDFSKDEKKIIMVLRDIETLGTNDDMIRIRSNNDLEFFKGNWLEVFVYNEALNKKNVDGDPIFDDCDMSLEIKLDQAEKEIDVACIYEAQLIHCSCKTDKDPFKTLYLDEMRSISSMIGGRFCSRVFVTNAVFSDQTKQKQFLDQAKQREIVVVTGNELTDIGKILAKQALNPDFWRV